MSVVLALLVSAVLLLKYLQSKILIKNDIQVEVFSNMDMGFQAVDRLNLEYNVPKIVELDQTNESELSINKKPWGFFDVVQIDNQTASSLENVRKVGLLGGNTSNRANLYLSDKRSRLVVVGTTEISGNIHVPNGFIKQGNISGNHFSGFVESEIGRASCRERVYAPV